MRAAVRVMFRFYCVIWWGQTQRLPITVSGRERDSQSQHRVADELALLYVHAPLIEQALVNVLESAARFSEYAQRLYPAGVVSVPLSGQSPTIELALAYHPDNRTPALEAFLQVF